MAMSQYLLGLADWLPKILNNGTLHGCLLYTKSIKRDLSDETEELLKRAAEYAINDHGYIEEDIIIPEMQQNIRAHIKEV
jgi:predicted small metal-binding protein